MTASGPGRTTPKKIALALPNSIRTSISYMNNVHYSKPFHKHSKIYCHICKTSEPAETYVMEKITWLEYIEKMEQL